MYIVVQSPSKFVVFYVHSVFILSNVCTIEGYWVEFNCTRNMNENCKHTLGRQRIWLFLINHFYSSIEVIYCTVIIIWSLLLNKVCCKYLLYFTIKCVHGRVKYYTRRILISKIYIYIIVYSRWIGYAFKCYSSVGKDLEKKWNEDGAEYDCRTEANALKRRCVKFNLSKWYGS